MANLGSVASINNWPGNGNASKGEPTLIAPFKDLNGNNIYEPANGEYPLIRGEESHFAIFNEDGPHGESEGTKMKIDVKTLISSFENRGLEDGVTMVNLNVTNRSNMNYSQVYVGIYVDFDLGNYLDDYTGCDTTRNLFFAYNGDNDDQGEFGFGSSPPAVGCMFLNEKLGGYKTYDNDFTAYGNPHSAGDYYNYLKIRNKNGDPALDPTGSSTKFMYYGDVNTPGSWSETRLGNTPSDQRGLGVIGPFNLEKGESICFDLAYFSARGSSNLASVDDLQSMADEVQALYDNGSLTNRFSLCNNQTAGISNPTSAPTQVRCYPNPASQTISFQLPTGIQNDVKIDVINNLGQIIEQQEFQLGEGVTLDLKGLSSGIYTAIIHTRSQTYHSRFVKN